jgi:hypothetical protein
LSKIHHPIDLHSGALQTAEGIEMRFSEQFDMIKNNVEEAGLSESSINHVEKSKRAFDLIVEYLKHFYIVYKAFLDDLKLSSDQETFFNEVIFPYCYLKMTWRRLPKKQKKENKALLEKLEAEMLNAAWSDDLKMEWMKKGNELAERFQRSSSCVEGRNSLLSLNHHRLHKMSERTLRALSIVHNFDTYRSDGSTPAERLFKEKHDSLFDFLVKSVKIPGKPRNQKHKSENRRKIAV